MTRSTSSLSGDGADLGWQVFEEERPPRRHRPRLLAIGLAALAGLVAVLISTGGAEDDASDPTTLPSRSGPTTTRPVATTSVGPTTVAVSVAPLPPARTLGSGPVFGAPVGRRLVGVTRDGEGGWLMVDIDLDTGDTTRTPVPGLSEPDQYGAGLIPIDHGALVYAMSGPAALVQDDGHVYHVGADYPQTVYPGPDSSSAWWVDYGGNGGGPVLQQVQLSDSTVLASVVLDYNLQVLGPDGDGGVFVTMLGGRTWRIRPGGVIDPTPTVKGTVIAAGHGQVIEERCDDQLRCSLVAHPLDSTEGVSVGLNGPPFSAGEVSPDGRAVAVWLTNRITGTIELTTFDLTTGEVRVLVSNNYDQLPANVAWISPELLVFDQGIDLRSVRLDEAGAQPQPIVVDGTELDLALFGVSQKPVPVAAG